MREMSAFDPSRFLTRVNGREYLEVKWRLVWLRTIHPDATIETELINHSDALAIFRARVSLPSGAAATGWGSETPGDFGDYLEKAETKALGRALAALGFGTQFCPDFEFGAAHGRVVDTPVDLRTVRGQQHAAGNTQADDAPRDTGEATPRQIAFLRRLTREAGMQASEVEQRSADQFGKPVAELRRQEISMLIEALQRDSQDPLAAAS